MNLRHRGVATDAPTAALHVAAAGRFLASAGIAGGRIWVDDSESQAAKSEGWANGTVVVRVAGSAAREAALATAEAFGLAASPQPANPTNEVARADGDRLAARYEFGLWADETVELVLGPAALHGLDVRLAAFDAALAAEWTPHRLVLAGLPHHAPALGPDLVAAIVHPQVLVETEPSDPSMLEMLRVAADTVVEEDR
jgi:hypothetical protein